MPSHRPKTLSRRATFVPGLSWFADRFRSRSGWNVPAVVVTSASMPARAVSTLLVASRKSSAFTTTAVADAGGREPAFCAGVVAPGSPSVGSDQVWSGHPAPSSCARSTGC
jgi:hypothetical protein